ncbi:hypothetical protein HU762_07625 [Pseudomonas sp. SWRI92]|uniref:hypothetical protein n=1 Tax=Pseudomonas sp. SWRI92 TaxID=2745499 RepID=UPI0016448D70|nr:hypothetical protein [Pseudomonas sp. SWRI92]MBC3373811.1 hypothetical protein [Pseudomonas sp. SWRI92]
MSLYTIKVTLHSPDGFQLPESGGTHINFTTPHTSGGSGSNQIPTKMPWIVSFTVDSDVVSEGEEFSVGAQITGPRPLFLDTPHTFTWNGGDQEVDFNLILAPVSTEEDTEPFAFGS